MTKKNWYEIIRGIGEFNIPSEILDSISVSSFIVNIDEPIHSKQSLNKKEKTQNI